MWSSRRKGHSPVITAGGQAARGVSLISFGSFGSSLPALDFEPELLLALIAAP